MTSHAPRPDVTRRTALTWVGIAGAATVASLRARALAACALTPAQTEGPYWVDERLNRSDIRADPSDGSIEPGVPLQLVLNVLRADDDCAPASGIQVDIWHCDASGLYSDEAANGTVGRKFLRGYQVSDETGAVRFTTVYPGWYRGRTIHIHFRVRAFDGATTAYDITSQVYFDDAVSDAVMAQAPYNTRGNRDTSNAEDGIYDAATLLALESDGARGYVGTYDIALNDLPAVTTTPAASPSPTSTPSPGSATPTVTPETAICAGDCDGNGEVVVNELVSLVKTALGDPSATCPNGIPAGSDVDVSFLVRSVKSALTGCS